MGKSWIKIYVEEWESGSVRVDMDSAERGFWLDMLLRASHSRKEGFICRDANGTIGFTVIELAADYHVSVELAESTIAKRLSDNSIIIHDNNVIEIVNYWKYQSKIRKNGHKPIDNEQIPLDSEHKEMQGKVMAYKSAKKYPDDAEKGVVAARFEKAIKRTNV